jgi:uncharacterized SAM-binding protein YcdF (DUF218 family)
LFVCLAAFFLRKNILLQAMADYLVIADNPVPSDCLIVLGGELKGERTEQAVMLYRQGMASALLFSDGTDLSWRTRAVDEMTALAREMKIPQKAILTEEKSRSTYENALYTKAILKRQNWHSAIVVTSNWHTRRSRFIFNKVYRDTGITLTFAGAKDKRFDSFDTWWQDPEKQQVVLTEWAKLIVYWLKYGLR